MNIGAWLAVLPGLAVAAEAALPAHGLDQAALAARARAYVEETGAKGVAIALVHADGRVVSAAAGVSGREARPAIDGDTLFEIGSITKAFNGILVASLVREGALKLDDPIDRHLPEARSWKPGAVRAVTVGQLMTHTSGLPRLPSDAWFYLSMVRSPGNPYAHYSREDLFAYLSRAQADPGVAHELAYSNLGVGLLGHVVAARAGKPWEELLRERVTGPLGMASTRVAVPPGDEDRFARGHFESGLRAGYWDLPAFTAAGALRSSTNDLSRLVAAALTHKPPFTPDFFTPLRGLDGNPLPVGNAWFLRRGVAGDTWWHNGGTGGFRTFVGVMPARDIGVVVLSNSAISVDALGNELLGEAPRPPARGRSPVPALVFGAVGLVLLARLALYRFGPAAAPGGRRRFTWSRDTVAEFMAFALAACGTAMVVFTFGPFDAPLRWTFVFVAAGLLALAAGRFVRGARAQPALRWLPEARTRAQVALAVTASFWLAMIWYVFLGGR